MTWRQSPAHGANAAQRKLRSFFVRGGRRVSGVYKDDSPPRTQKAAVRISCVTAGVRAVRRYPADQSG